MASKPLWKEAIELKEQYNERGIGYCYNQRNKNVYLTVLNAPTVAIGNYEGCQLTGYLIVYGGVTASRDIEKWVEEVKRQYITAWGSNSEMLKFAETIN